MDKVEIGNATLYCGDCLEILPALGDVDVAITDPPYGISDKPIQGEDRTGKRTGKVNTWHPPSTWDASINPGWCEGICRVTDVVLWFGHWRKRALVEDAMSHKLRAEIIWAKDCHVGPPCPVAYCDERIWLFSRRGFKAQRFETTIWDEPIIPTWSRRLHKNEKPLRLMRRAVSFAVPEDAVVLDPFMGSGTTGVAAVELGRKFIGIEIDPDYFNIACKRINAAQRQGKLAI